MFKALTTGDAHTVLAIIAFALTATVFAVGVWRAVRLRPEERDHLASLPLDDGETTELKNSHSHGRKE